MSEGVGLSIGATNLTAVVVGRTALTRSAVLTLYPHRPPEVGVPSENPNLTERGLIITDFVDRVGDPVGIVASDGSTHRADSLIADALRAMLVAVGHGQPPADAVGVTYPAHWRPSAVEGLRNALAALPEFARPKPAPVVSDAAAALIALQHDPGVPTRGVIALCDFGGTGTSITLVDAANGFTPIAPTVRHPDLSGDLIDQALLTHVINDLSAAGTIDLSGTSAIGSLSRLRGQCRGAKERLSTSAVTSLVAELPGHRTDVRLTRTELDDAIRQPLAEFVGVVQETVERSGIRPADLVAVASAGGGARIPFITTTLSERFRVPVDHHRAAGADGSDRRGPCGSARHGRGGHDVDGLGRPCRRSSRRGDANGARGRCRRRRRRAPSTRWHGPTPRTFPTWRRPIRTTTPHPAAASPTRRPPVQFDHEPWEEQEAPPPWYRRPAALIAGVAAALAAARVRDRVRDA